MKRFSLILLILFAGIIYGFSQEDSGKREKMFREVQEFKMKYLAQEMDLSEVQKKKFFEVYQEMEKSRQECFHDAVKLDRNIKKNKDATEEEYQQATEAMNKANSVWSEKEKLYNEKLSEFLTQKQIYKMKEAEMNFKSKLDEMRHNRKKSPHKPKEEHKK